ncbi:DUF4192 domain-containing protein [Williamsia maris]|nr:DUF4192 domain-containing protein [Williamsia maris]
MTTDPRTVTFRDPGDLIAAVPAMVGFIPERSLVLLAFDASGTRIGVTMRHDLDLDADGIATEAMEVMIAHLCEICLRDNTSGVFALVIDDRFEIDAPSWDHLFALIDTGLDHLGLYTGFVVADMALGQPWRTRWGAMGTHGDRGILDDPRSSPMAVAHAVTTGRVVLRSRSQMVDSTARTTHCGDPSCTYAVDSRTKAAAVGLGESELLRRVLDAVLHGLDTHIGCTQLRVLEAAIRRPPVRDALLALAVSDVADAAEAVWAELTRRLRGGGRACAATLLGHLHYVRGDGAMAGVALDCALDSDVGHSLAALLDRSLRAGLRPSTLEELLPTSYAAADKLGVIMPAPAERAAG